MKILLIKKETPAYIRGVVREEYNQSFKLQCSSISRILGQWTFKSNNPV